MSSHRQSRSDTLVASSTPDASSEVSQVLGSMVASSERRLLAGRYELLGLVGEGGMGTVYRARDLQIDDEVALKVLRRDVVESPEVLARFRRELKLARRVTSRNVARSHDIGEDGEIHFLTMEYIDGEPLSKQLGRRMALPCKRVIEIARGICRGLEAAHAVGVVHCDLKPENILIDRDDRVVITDFGIARGLFDAGVRRTMGGVLGTPAYMAPEQVEGSRNLTPRADIYALGVMLYELFTGELPWKGDSVFAIAAMRLNQPPPDPRLVRPELPEALARLVLRCLARQPADRYASATELDVALGSLCLDDVPSAPAVARATVMSPAAREATPTGKAVAVLPFRSLGSADDMYLVDGLTEDLIDQLSMTPGLKVRPRGAVMHLRGQDRDAQEVGRELGVQVVVEGSLRRAGDTLRVSTRLISVSDGFQLWAKRYDCKAADVLSLSDEVALAIAEALTVAPQAAAPRAAPTDPRALDAYFRGRFEYHKFDTEALTRAVSHLEEAKALAPDDPMILAGYALACTRHWFLGMPGRSEQARAAAERAYALAPQRAEPLIALASYSFFAGNVEQAVRHLRQAISLNAQIPDAHDLLGKILVETGPLSRGIEHLERSARLDPTFRATSSPNVARALSLLGNHARADEILRDLLREDPSRGGAWLQFSRQVAWRGDLIKARELLAATMEGIQQPFSQAILRNLLGEPVEGDPMHLLNPLFNSPTATWRSKALYQQGRCEFALGRRDHEAALEALSDAVDVGLIDQLWLDRCPIFLPLVTQPRFQQLRAVVADRARRIREAAGETAAG